SEDGRELAEARALQDVAGIFHPLRLQPMPIAGRCGRVVLHRHARPLTLHRVRAGAGNLVVIRDVHDQFLADGGMRTHLMQSSFLFSKRSYASAACSSGMRWVMMPSASMRPARM